MEIVKVIILERGMDDILWLEVVLTMIHIKNFRPTWALEEVISLIKKQEGIQSSL